MILFVLLSPGLVLSWFRLQWGERMVALAVAAFLAFPHAPWAIAFVWAAMFWKEPLFLSLGVYALASHNYALLIGPAVYVALYLCFVVPYLTRAYSASLYRWPLVAVKNLANYAFFSDPLVLLVGVPLAVLHATPGLLAGCAYLVVVLAANVYAPYYLLPALVWMAPSIAVSWSLLPTWWYGIVAVAWLGNTLPAALHYLTYSVYVPRNFQRVLRWIRPYKTMWLGGVDRSRHSSAFLVWTEFLRFSGWTNPVVDSLEPATTTAMQVLNERDLASVSAYNGTAPDVRIGDYLVIGPDALRAWHHGPHRWRVAFSTHSPFHVPFWTLKTFLKRILAKRWTEEQQRGEGWMVSQSEESPDYWVLVKT